MINLKEEKDRPTSNEEIFGELEEAWYEEKDHRQDMQYICVCAIFACNYTGYCIVYDYYRYSTCNVIFRHNIYTLLNNSVMQERIIIFMNEKKYELTENFIKVLGKKLYRIRALRDFGDVKTGDLGGYIEKWNNLFNDGDAWV